MHIDFLNLINDYISNRCQRAKISEKSSMLLELIYGVQQGSILGALFFKICIHDIFLFSIKTSKIANG